MEIIPAINAVTFDTAKSQILAAAAFAKWIHIDVTDGIFTRNFTWGKPDELHQLILQNPVLKSVNFEVHLMVTTPEYLIEPWLRSGAKRVILHVEAMSNPVYVLEIVKQLGGEVTLAAKPSTPAERLLIYQVDFPNLQILAVDPGLAGQAFQATALEKIKTLRAKSPNVTIEVDGGINLETAKQCKEAGANILVSASAIFGSDDPKKAYEALVTI